MTDGVRIGEALAELVRTRQVIEFSKTEEKLNGIGRRETTPAHGETQPSGRDAGRVQDATPGLAA